MKTLQHVISKLFRSVIRTMPRRHRRQVIEQIEELFALTDEETVGGEAFDGRIHLRICRAAVE